MASDLLILLLYPIALLAPKKYSPFVFIAFLMTLYWTGFITIIGILTTIVFFALAFIFYNNASEKLKYLLLVALFVCFALASARTIPGISALTVTENIQKSSDSLPYNLRLNFALPSIIFPLWYFFNKNRSEEINLRTVIFHSAGAVALIIGLTLLLGFGRYDFQIMHWQWFFINLFYYCFGEEIIFRGILQNEIAKYTDPKRAILIAALIFGLLHFIGGIKYIILASVAGYTYGYFYYRFGHIGFAIFIHFLINSIHYIFFSYPALKF